MTVIDVIAMPSADVAMADSYDYSRLPNDLRNQALLAEGTVVQGLSSAVKRVLDAGQALAWAKAALPHGEYLPWVQKACGLKPRYAQKLIQAAEWSNAAHAAHLEGATDTTTLFILSADTTTDDVREWFMERAAAGKPPSRKEVQERKRQSSDRPLAHRPIELQALALWRQAQLDVAEAALALARSITTASDAEVQAEIGLRELPKSKTLQGMAADYHRLPDGSGWARIPHAGHIEMVPVTVPEMPSAVKTRVATAQAPIQSELLVGTDRSTWELVSLAEAARRLGVRTESITQSLSPCKMKGRSSRKRKGRDWEWEIAPSDDRGMCRIRRAA